MSKNIYFVYEHWRPDRDEPFYVGKGFGWRSQRMSPRNSHHKNIQKKLARLGMCVEVRMVAEAISEDDAFAIEVERIAFWKAAGVKLANRTIGGEGLSNPPAHVRKKISDSAKGNKRGAGTKRSEEQKRAIAARMKGNKIWEGREFTDKHRKNISAALKGRPGRVKTAEEKEKIGAFNRGRKRPPETIAKMSASIKKSWEKRSHDVSDETRAKISAAVRGRKMGPEELLRHSQKIKKTWEMRSRTSSPETKAKIAEGLRRAYAEGRRK